MAVLRYGASPHGMVSPELALVDPDLASSRPAVVDVVAAAAARPARPAPWLVVVHPGPSSSRRPPAPRWALLAPRRGLVAGRRRARVVGAFAAVVVAVSGAMLAIHRTAGPEPTAQQAPMETSNIGSVPSVEPNREPTQAPPAKPAAVQAPEVRRLAWSPVAGAVGYNVELFLGEDRVLSRRTASPVLEVPRTWSSEGRQHTLVPAEYRWYVWPITDAGRASSAVVQATLVVTD